MKKETGKDMVKIMDSNTIDHILSRVDHTLLKQDATEEQISRLCDQAVKYHTASVCVPPSYVSFCRKYLGDRMRVCTVIGFPNGYQIPEVKALEAKKAIDDGADEIDMVINIAQVKNGRFDKVYQEIRLLRETCGSHILKVIIETCLLTDSEKIKMCRIVTEAKADFIKTSTGFSTAGATFEDVKLFREHVGPDVKIKAAGGIRDFADAERFMELGADRLGTSRLVNILEAENDKNDENKILIKEALAARKLSYSPYSKFAVGAAILSETGKIFTGTNIENSSFSLTNCAERTAIFKAVSKGERSFKKIAIAGGKAGNDPDSYTPPCGACLQVMSEFVDPDKFIVILARNENDYVEHTLREFLPYGFSLS